MTGHPFDAIADGIDALPAMVPGVCMPAGPQVDQLASWLRWTPCRDVVVESAVPASLAVSGQGSGGEPPDFDAELGATWRERIESVIDEQIDAGIASGERRGAEDFARAIADEFGVADSQWVTMADPYTLPFPARGAVGTEIAHAEVVDLPPGSWVLELNQNGAPAFGTATTPIVTTSYPMRRPTKAPADRLLVVARGRGSEPVRVLAVGDPVRTADELDALPDTAVLRSGPQRTTIEKVGTRWYAPGVSFALNAPHEFLPARVLDLPADRAPATDGGAS